MESSQICIETCSDGSKYAKRLGNNELIEPEF